MKRRITLSIALVASLAILLYVQLDSTVQAETPRRFIADTGIISLGANQSLRVTVVRSSQSASEPPVEHIVQFRQITYAETGCGGGICKQAAASVVNSGVITLLPGESSWATFPSGIVRGVVLTNRSDVQVNAIIIDDATGEVLSIDKCTPLIAVSS